MKEGFLEANGDKQAHIDEVNNINDHVYVDIGDLGEILVESYANAGKYNLNDGKKQKYEDKINSISGTVKITVDNDDTLWVSEEDGSNAEDDFEPPPRPPQEI